MRARLGVDGRGHAQADVWEAVADRLDFGGFVPRPRSGVESRELRGRDGQSYHVLRSPAARYVRLDDEDYALWSLMDGQRSVRDIALAHFVNRGTFVADRLARLIGDLRRDGFIDPPPLDCFVAVDANRPRPLLVRLPRLAAFALNGQLVRFGGADDLFGRAYRSVGWLAYTPLAKLVWLVAIVIGLIVWWWEFAAAEHSLIQTRGSYALGLATLAILDLVGINLHVLAQGLTIKRHGRRINGAGVALVFGVPTLFIESSDTWLAERRQRMAVSASGPAAMLILGSLLAIVTLPLEGGEMGGFLFKAATICMANAFFNLLPILDVDGYFLLVDYLEMPALRANASAFAHQALLPKLLAREPFTREERIFTGFALLSWLFFLLIPILIFQARNLRHADTFWELWTSPELGSELLAIGMAVALVGPAFVPILRQIAMAILGIGRHLAHRWRLWRGEVPREYIEALADVAFLRDVPRPELVAIARHLDRLDASAGTILIRQGAVGDRFFLLLVGTVRVTKQTSDGRQESLARLGPGDHFGETALVARVPRTASVVAETDVKLLTLDAGHFRRWVGDRIELANAVRRSLAERDRLARLPLFRGSGPAELERLTAHLLVTRHSPGDVIVRQGEPGDRFYLLMDGRVEVIRETADGQERLAELGEGDYFGEMALVHDTPRTATVRALTPVETYSLNANDFRALLGRLPAAEAIRDIAAQRAAAQAAPPALGGDRA